MKTVVWTIRVVIFDILGIYLFFIDKNLSITIIVNIRVVGIDIIKPLAEVQKLGASPPSPAQEPEQASSPLVLTLLSPPKLDVKAKGLSSAAVAPPLAALPITVWNPPSDNAKSPPRGMAEPTRKKSKPKAGVIKDSLLSNPKLAAGAISSILLEMALGGRKGCRLMKLWLYLFRGLPR